MKRIAFSWCVVFPIIILFQGCAYGPHLVQAPLMHEKNQAQISVGLSLPSLPALSLAAAYAPTDHLAIQAQGEYLFPFFYHAQLALGYYKLFPNNTVLENYYGAEIGNVNGYLDANPGHLSGTYTIGFAQINYGKIGLKAHGEIGCGLKIGYQYGDFIDDNYYTYSGAIRAAEKPFYYHGMVFEPTLFYRFGWEHFRIGLQIAGCYAPSFVEHQIPYIPLNAGISFNYTF